MAKKFWFLLVTSFTFSLLRLPSLFEPYWYGDEGIYETIGLAIRNGRLLYKDIWDNKPPLFYLVYALFSGDQFYVRVLSLIFGVLSVVVFFFLISKLFEEYASKNQKIAFLTTALFAFFFATPLLEGNIANSENLMLLPILTSGLIIFNIFKQTSPDQFKISNLKFQIFIAGFLLSLAFLFKIVAIFDFTAFFLFIFFITFPPVMWEYNQILTLMLKFIKTIFPFLIGSFFPILLVALYFFLKGAFSDFFKASFSQNVGYVGWGNTFIIPQGFLILKLIGLVAVSFIIFIKRHRLNASLIFTLLWFSFSVFNAFFSGRPYTHYILVLLPSFMLFLGFIFERFILKTFYTISLIGFIIVFILVIRSFNFYTKTPKYYANFLLFIANQKNVSSYRAFFDRNTPRDYEIAQFVKNNSKANDSIFVWGDTAQLYLLTSTLPPGRFTVAYHILASKTYIHETYKAFLEKKPRFVIITTKYPLVFPLVGYRQRYIISNSQIYERVF